MIGLGTFAALPLWREVEVDGPVSGELRGRKVCKDLIGAERCRWKGIDSEMA
jgi:hypothetical protein